MSYRIDRRIGVSQTNRDGEMSLRAALDAIIDCCYFELEALDAFGSYLNEHGLGMYLVHVQADIYRRPAYGEDVSIETSIYGCSGIRGYRNTLIRDSEGKVCIATYSTGAFVDRNTGRPQKLSAEVVDSFGLPPRYDMEYLPPKIDIPADAEWERLPLIPVQPQILDMNKHVNSNWYVTFAEEMLPPDFHYSRVRVEYKRQTTCGEFLQVEACTTPSGARCVRILNSEGELKVVVEFS